MIWIVISTISATVAAIASLFAIINARRAWKERIKSDRPYITIKEPGFKRLGQSPPFRMQIIMINIGIRPAYDLIGKIIIIDKELRDEPLVTFDFSVANEIPTQTPTPWYTDGVQLPSDVSAQYIMLAIKYSDPILKQSFSQVFFMK